MISLSPLEQQRDLQTIASVELFKVY